MRLATAPSTAFDRFPASALLVCIFSLEAGAMSRVLRTSPFLYLGSLSYAIYLVPWPLLYILTQYAAPPAAYYLAVLVAAAFTHHVVEVAARRFLMSRSPTAWRAGAVRNASTRT